ncbi:hypothetical protein FRC11_012045, partial [Ceratobasidium sp. 423]
ADQFAARVLLPRSPEDGSQRYKPIGPRLQPKAKILKLINSGGSTMQEPPTSESEEEEISHSDKPTPEPRVEQLLKSKPTTHTHTDLKHT